MQVKGKHFHRLLLKTSIIYSVDAGENVKLIRKLAPTLTPAVVGTGIASAFMSYKVGVGNLTVAKAQEINSKESEALSFFHNMEENKDMGFVGKAYHFHYAYRKLIEEKLPDRIMPSPKFKDLSLLLLEK